MKPFAPDQRMAAIPRHLMRPHSHDLPSPFNRIGLLPGLKVLHNQSITPFSHLVPFQDLRCCCRLVCTVKSFVADAFPDRHLDAGLCAVAPLSPFGNLYLQYEAEPHRVSPFPKGQYSGGTTAPGTPA